MASVFGSFGSARRGAAEEAAPADRRPRIDGIPVDRIPPVIAEARRGTRRRVTVVGEDVLARACRPVTQFGTPGLKRLIDDMHATMACCDGVGLAANQVGVDLRVFVYDCEDAWGVRHVGHVVNPTLEAAERGGKESSEEGCLSVPGPVADVSRAKSAVVRGVDMFGKPVVVEGTGTLARCLQHECDHLEGRLYLDRLSSRERKKVLRAMEEQQGSTWERWDERAVELGKPRSADLSPEPPVVEDAEGAAAGASQEHAAELDAGIVGYDPAAYAEPPVPEAPEEASLSEARSEVEETVAGEAEEPVAAEAGAALRDGALPEGASYDDVRVVATPDEDEAPRD